VKKTAINEPLQNLPGFEQTNFPTIQSEETLYSWCARLHRLRVGLDPHATSRLLFGHPFAGLRHDIPFNIRTFEKNTHSQIGTAEEILLQRTLFGFHAQFLPEQIENEILELFRGSQNSIARGKLGLKRGWSFLNPLKLCHGCISEQCQTHGFSWWQTMHQLPTAFFCNTHGISLRVVTVPQYRGIAQDFYLPEIKLDQLAHDYKDASTTVQTQLKRINDWGFNIWNDDSVRLTDENLRWCYLLQAKARGWIAFDGSVRMQELRDSFLTQYGEMLGVFDLGFLGSLTGANCGFLSYLFRQAPSRRHPLKHVLLINFLFESFTAFQSAFRNVSGILANENSAELEAQLRDSQATLVRLVAEEGHSVTRAASTLGVSVTSATKFLDKRTSVPREHRPRIVGTAKEVQLCRLLRQGLTRKEISVSVGIRLAFIKDYLSLRPELRNRWKEAHRQRQRKMHREQLLTILQAYPGLPIKAIRRLPNNGFQWLYNHDINWLREILPAIWKR
jgi:hypothetical protein